MLSGNIESVGDFYKALGIGALSGAAGFGAGQFIAGGLATATTFTGAVANGALVGGVGGSLLVVQAMLGQMEPTSQEV